MPTLLAALPDADPAHARVGRSRRRAAGVKAPSVKTWISARGSRADQRPRRAHRLDQPGRQVAGARAADGRQRAVAVARRARPSRVGCTPASITMTSAPSPRRRTSAAASPRATSNRDGDDVARLHRGRGVEHDDDLAGALAHAPSRRAAPAPASSASSARIWRMSSGSRCSRWKNVEASRSRMIGCHSRRLEHPALAPPHLEEVQQHQRQRQREDGEARAGIGSSCRAPARAAARPRTPRPACR